MPDCWGLRLFAGQAAAVELCLAGSSLGFVGGRLAESQFAPLAGQAQAEQEQEVGLWIVVLLFAAGLSAAL